MSNCHIENPQRSRTDCLYHETNTMDDIHFQHFQMKHLTFMVKRLMTKQEETQGTLTSFPPHHHINPGYSNHTSLP